MAERLSAGTAPSWRIKNARGVARVQAAMSRKNLVCLLIRFM
jgi:hypothetical protein